MAGTWFENDVEMYGAQTFSCYNFSVILFENDVEMYGAQTYADRKLERATV